MPPTSPPTPATSTPTWLWPGRRGHRWCSPRRCRRCTAPIPSAVASTVHVDGVSEGLEGASRPGALRRGVHGGGQALRPVGAVPGLLRREGLPAAGRGPAHGRPTCRMPVTVVGCATVREVDGSGHVEPQHPAVGRRAPRRRGACTGPCAAGRACVERGERDPVRVTAAMTAVLVAEPLVTPDYAVVVDPHDPAVPDRAVRRGAAARGGPGGSGQAHRQRRCAVRAVRRPQHRFRVGQYRRGALRCAGA